MNQLIQQLRRQLPETQVITDELRLLAYGTDASFYRLTPQVIAVIESESELQAVLETAQQTSTPVTFRAAGTSLSGQAITDGILDDGESLAERRRRETYVAAEILGVSRVEFLGFTDSGIMGDPANGAQGSFWSEPVDEAARRSAEATGQSVEEVFAATLRKRPIPAGRLGEPEEVSAMISFLCTDRAGYTTGQIVSVNGGIAMS